MTPTMCLTNSLISSQAMFNYLFSDVQVEVGPTVRQGLPHSSNCIYAYIAYIPFVPNYNVRLIRPTLKHKQNKSCGNLL